MPEFGVLIAICMCVIIMIGFSVNHTEQFVEYNSDNIENDIIQDDITKELNKFNNLKKYENIYNSTINAQT